MRDNRQEAEKAGRGLDYDTGLTGGCGKERGKEGRLGRKSLRSQYSSEQVLARLKVGPTQSLLIGEVPYWAGMASVQNPHQAQTRAKSGLWEVGSTVNSKVQYV